MFARTAGWGGVLPMSDPVSAYDGRATELAKLYESLPFEQAHAASLDLVPERPGLVLDVGAGSGRDARWFGGHGWDVVAVEPADGMRREGQQRHAEAPIRWLSDRLPGLETVHRLGLMFDLIWLSAVWMHVPPPERQRAFRKLVTLLKPGGRLVLTLRHGPAPPDRPMHETSAAEIERLGLEFGLITLRVREHPDRLGRSDVRWTLVCLQLPDDSTGALPLLRSVILNDSKSSTYKLALLRVIARIADSAGGLAAPGDSDRIRIPLGLVALYWIRMFKPLLQAGLPQSPANKGLEGLGFVRDGFRGILHIPAQDLRIGASLGSVDARALNRAVSDAARLIARMPAFYTTYADGQPIFPARSARSPAMGERLVVDADWLWRFGEVEVPRHVWNAVRHLNVWIEPIVVAEWARLMQGYGERQGRTISMDELHRALAWLDPLRDTRLARSLADDLMNRGEPVFCVWSGKRLDQRTLDVDHCFPWVVWPCGDLWNLLPSSRQVNQRLKRDRLVDVATLASARDRIADWWARGYARAPSRPVNDRFVREAVATLSVDRPGDEARLLDEIYAGVEWQRMRLRNDQRVDEWSGMAPADA
jgi:SAM-dependent methyltransferase